jgi:ATP-dependent 26S proteasome regulatory subunit
MEIGLPDEHGRFQILKIHTSKVLLTTTSLFFDSHVL